MQARDQWFFYVSRSARGVSARDVDEIVRVSQVRNRARGVTGMLLFTGAHFAQVLEGEPSTLDEVVRGILADSRHADVRVLRHAPLQRRRFRQWSLRAVTHVGRADLIDDLLDTPDMPVERAQRLATELFRFPPGR